MSVCESYTVGYFSKRPNISFISICIAFYNDVNLILFAFVFAGLFPMRAYCRRVREATGFNVDMRIGIHTGKMFIIQSLKYNKISCSFGFFCRKCALRCVGSPKVAVWCKIFFALKDLIWMIMRMIMPENDYETCPEIF